MSKFRLGKKVPTVYSYPLSRNEVKAIAGKLQSIGEFTYSGISPHDQIKDEGSEIWLGQVRGIRAEGEWSFTLFIYANRNDYVSGIMDVCKEILVSDASRWIAMQLEQPESYPDGTNSLYISITNKSGQYRSNSSEHTTTQWQLA